jgi:hypothetical protein
VASSKVLSRLRKLLALARSANAHESASARAKAEALMASHSLTEADAAVPVPDEVVEHPVGSRGFEEAWKFKLATVAARRHGCEALGLRVGRRRKVRLVGLRDDVAAAAALLKFLDLEVRRLSRAELAGVVVMLRTLLPSGIRRASERYLRYFREGIVDGLAALLRLERRGSGGGDQPTGDVSAGADAEPSKALARVEVGGDSPGVGERVRKYGAREVSGEGADEDFDDLAEAAYRSGLRQAASVQVSGERKDR